YRLFAGVQRDGDTWRYDLQDRSGANVRALIADPAVDDTAGIDRQTGDMAAAGHEAADELLFGSAPCTSAGEVQVIQADLPGGEVQLISEAPVAGVVFTSEPYYPERIAFVDDHEVRSTRAD